MHLYCQSLSQYLKRCVNITNIATNRHTDIAKQSYTTRRKEEVTQHPAGFPGEEKALGRTRTAVP